LHYDFRGIVKKTPKLDALFFAAHPDDAELCAGGTIIELVKSGKKAGIIDLTRGELGTRGTVHQRTKETEKATRILGISVRENLSISDGNIENSPENRLKVITAIRKYRPAIIFFPHYYDRHSDHYNTHHLVKDSSFYSGLSKIVTPGLKPHRPKRNIYYMQTYTFEPNLILDISGSFKQKMKAVSCYSTQFYNPKVKGPKTLISGKKFFDYITARAKFYGFQIDAEYGEAFYTEEQLKISIKHLTEI
jgi:N-acetylglucosamine malate deacetylase 1